MTVNALPNQALNASFSKNASPTSTSSGPLLTIACPAGPQNYTRLPLAALTPSLDFYNLMAYDYAGSWSSAAGHQANLYPSHDEPASTEFSTATAIGYYTDRTTGGVPAGKMVLGMPLYGRGFGHTDGPGAPFSGAGDGGSWEQGVWDYKALPRAGAAVQHDVDGVGAAWSYDAATRHMVSFDDVVVARKKAAYVRDGGLGGVMWWESSGDWPLGEGSLIEAVSFFSGFFLLFLFFCLFLLWLFYFCCYVLSGGFGRTLLGSGRRLTLSPPRAQVTDVLAPSDGHGRLDDGQNRLDYPASKYDNLRNGMPGA